MVTTHFVSNLCVCKQNLGPYFQYSTSSTKEKLEIYQATSPDLSVISMDDKKVALTGL